MSQSAKNLHQLDQTAWYCRRPRCLCHNHILLNDLPLKDSLLLSSSPTRISRVGARLSSVDSMETPDVLKSKNSCPDWLPLAGKSLDSSSKLSPDLPKSHMTEETPEVPSSSLSTSNSSLDPSLDPLASTTEERKHIHHLLLPSSGNQASGSLHLAPLSQRDPESYAASAAKTFPWPPVSTPLMVHIDTPTSQLKELLSSPSMRTNPGSTLGVIEPTSGASQALPDTPPHLETLPTPSLSPTRLSSQASPTDQLGLTAQNDQSEHGGPVCYTLESGGGAYPGIISRDGGVASKGVREARVPRADSPGLDQPTSEMPASVLLPEPGSGVAQESRAGSPVVSPSSAALPEPKVEWMAIPLVQAARVHHWLEQQSQVAPSESETSMSQKDNQVEPDLGGCPEMEQDPTPGPVTPSCQGCGRVGHFLATCPHRTRCKLCGDVGHRHSHCPNQLQCQYCGRFGHSEASCRVAARDRYKAPVDKKPGKSNAKKSKGKAAAEGPNDEDGGLASLPT